MYTAVPLEKSPVESEPETSFFTDRTITTAVKKPKKKFNPPFLAGNLLKKHNQDIMEASALKKTEQQKRKNIKKEKKTSPSENLGKKGKAPSKRIGTSVKKEKNEKVPSKRKYDDEKPSTSGTSNKGGPINLTEDEDSEYSEDIPEEDLCCVCHNWQPKELSGCISVVFAQWAQCDFCKSLDTSQILF